MSYLLRLLAIAAALALLAVLLWPRGDTAVNSPRDPGAAPAPARVPAAGPAREAGGAVAPAPRIQPSPAPGSANSASASAQPDDPFKAFIEQAERARSDAAKSPFSRP
jgi:hypothetical protein